MSPNLLRSFPRKRESRRFPKRPWVPAFAGTNGKKASLPSLQPCEAVAVGTRRLDGPHMVFIALAGLLIHFADGRGPAPLAVDRCEHRRRKLVGRPVIND